MDTISKVMSFVMKCSNCRYKDESHLIKLASPTGETVFTINTMFRSDFVIEVVIYQKCVMTSINKLKCVVKCQSIIMTKIHDRLLDLQNEKSDKNSRRCFFVSKSGFFVIIDFRKLYRRIS